MQKLITVTFTILCFFIVQFTTSAQEQYGKTLNLGLGVGGNSGYSNYAGRPIPVFTANYEFNVANNFTLAPFISFYTFRDKYYWSNNNYTYSETVVPIGVKGTYYFDRLLNATSPWDFYAAGSVGFAIVNSRWDDGYDGDRKHFNKGNAIFADIHIGAEYHFNSRIGMFLDLSTGVSTLGIAIH